MTQTKERKRFKDLNLLDRVLFAEAMEDQQNMELLLDIILNQETHLKQPTQTEKELRRTNEDRQVRLDVYTVDFNALNMVVIILITPFDIFGHELYKYTFHMKCEEIPELQLDDGATRIFLNTHGKHPELVSEELIELLKYIELSTDETVEHCNSEKVQKLHQKICQLKANKQMEAKFMQAWEEKVLERQEAYEEGKQAGTERGRQEIVDLCGKLMELNRMKDMERAVKDNVYCEKLLEEFKLKGTKC